MSSSYSWIILNMTLLATPKMATKRPGSPSLSGPRRPQAPRLDPSPAKEYMVLDRWRNVSLSHNSLFASPVVTLQVGPHEQSLRAHRSILTNIDYFAVCLVPDRFVEGKSNTISLPEDDFDAIVQIMHYLCCSKLEHRALGLGSDQQQRTEKSSST